MKREDVARPDLADLCTYWKPWIGLDNFTTAITYCGHDGMEDEGHAGETDMRANAFKMWIRVLDPLLCKEDCLESIDVDRTVVHELLHTNIDQFFTINGKHDRAAWTFAEQCIHTITNALVDLDNTRAAFSGDDPRRWQKRNRRREAERVGKPDLKELLSYWIPRLDLRDYTIQAHYRSREWLTKHAESDTADAMAEITSNYCKGDLSILDPDDYKTEDMKFMDMDRDPEISLVHELLHIPIWKFFQHEGKAETTAVESFVEIIAQALVGLKRLSEGWQPHAE
jgi:hypothetical protein